MVHPDPANAEEAKKSKVIGMRPRIVIPVKHLLARIRPILRQAGYWSFLPNSNCMATNYRPACWCPDIGDPATMKPLYLHEGISGRSRTDCKPHANNRYFRGGRGGDGNTRGFESIHLHHQEPQEEIILRMGPGKEARSQII